MNSLLLLYSVLSAGVLLCCVALVCRHHRLIVKRLQRRLARDLHDDLGASLSNICFMSGLAAQNLAEGDPDKAKAFLQRIGAAAAEVHAGIGDSIAILGASCSQLGHLAALLNRNGYELLREKGMKFSLALPEALRSVTIPATRRRDLYLILKEALHNVMRHSGADDVKITFETDGRRLYCRITDNGCGFDPEKQHSGNGLKNMQRRAALIGGKLRFFSEPGKGCTLLLQVPLRPFWRPLRLSRHTGFKPSAWYAAAQARHKQRSADRAKQPAWTV
jgi:signal transduction histidine kinase